MILFADDTLVIADKPAGLLSVPGRGPDKQDCLIRRVQKSFPDVLTVHRLDQATSGLIAFGRGAASQRTLSIAFAGRHVVKRYIAVVQGHPHAEGEIDLPLIADWPNRPRQKVDHVVGKPSLTRYRTLARDTATARLELEPVTGRSHQLRVHMLAIGHPIVGDSLYAGYEEGSRLLLHAQALSLPHPITGVVMAFEAKAPF